MRSFVLRQGRMTKAQRRAYEDHWERYGLDPEDGLLDPIKVFLKQVDSVVRQPLVLEIGFGMGTSLHEMAITSAECNFVGVEVHRPGVGQLLGLAAKSDLGNLRIYHHDVIAVLKNCIGDQSLDRIQIYFPDPWPKNKHHKRRLINRDFLDLVGKKLKPSEGCLHLVTDWESYAKQIEKLMGENNIFQRSNIQIARPTTKYEQRARRLNHPIFEFVYQLKPA